MKCQLLDKRLNELMMMVLVRQTEDCDMLLYMVMTDMKLLVVQIETADITADDVDNVSCSTDVERSKQAKKESSDKECSTFRIKVEEYAMRMSKTTKSKNQRVFVGGYLSDSGVEDEKAKEETCLVAQASNEHYGVPWTLEYAVTSFKPARWKVHVSSLRHKPLKDLRGDQRLHSSKNSTRSPKEITFNLLLYLIVHKQLLLWFRWISFDYRVILGFGSIEGGLDHVNPVIRLPLKREISRALGVVKQKIGGNVNFEIKSQFMRELREDTFSRNKNEDAHDYVYGFLNIRSLFNIPRGPIPRMTPTQALTAIQTMADHSQKWHDGTSSRFVSSNSNTDRLAAIVRPYLDKECPLNEEVKQLEEVKYGEFRHSAPFNRSNGSKFCYFRLIPPSHLLCVCGNYISFIVAVDYLSKWVKAKALLTNDARVVCKFLKSLFARFGTPRAIISDLGASVNVMPRNTFEHLRLANMRNTNMLVEMADMTKKAPLGIDNARHVRWRDEIYEVPEVENLRFWYCNYDNERKNITGMGLSFLDYLLAKCGKYQHNSLVWGDRYAEWCNVSTTPGTSSQESNNLRTRDYTFWEWTLLKQEITSSCFHGFIDEDLINLVIADARRYAIVLTGFGSIVGGLDHVNLVIRLPLERRISRVPGLDDSKPIKTPMYSDTKLTKDEECESVDSTKYQGMIGTTHLRLWYPKGTDIETVVYADSDHARDYVDRKSTSDPGTAESSTNQTVITTNAAYQERILKEQINNNQASTSYENSLEIETLKHTMSEHLQEKESLTQKITLLKNNFQKEESRNIDKELALEKQTGTWFSKSMLSQKAQQLKPKLYDGCVIEKSEAIMVPDTEEILMLAEESLQTDEPNLSGTTIVEVPKELPKVSMVNSCFKKLKFHLANFDMVVKERTTATAITEGTRGFKHTKACFRNDIIPFVQSLKELFTSFDQWLINEVTEVQNVFTHMELAVEQHCEEKSKVQTKMENVLQENDRLLTQALSVEIVNIVVDENMKSVCLNVTACARCVTIETELKTEFLNNECYDMLLQKYHTLEKHCITLEVNNQLNTELFQRDTDSRKCSNFC
uniref:Reverse transcriptase domain-containing protein n=1 Tax=Tanacetum cinerariifolium TaxID=118510 RepID=A0A6L2NWQ1_TANCI|nr:reverse transcriptase domain-containing protein [Tanacetum cinerariifolium]